MVNLIEFRIPLEIGATHICVCGNSLSRGRPSVDVDNTIDVNQYRKKGGCSKENVT